MRRLLKQRLFLDTLWVVYGLIMMLAVNILLSGRHWMAVMPLVLLTILFMGSFMLLKSTVKQFSLGWMFGLFILLGALFYVFLHLSFVVLATAGAAYYLMISWWDEDRAPEFMWKTFFGFIIFCIGAVVLLLSYFPEVSFPYAYFILLAIEFVVVCGILAGQSRRRNELRNTAFFMGIFSICFLVGGAVLWFIRPVIQWFILKIVEGVSYVVILAVSQVLSWVIPADASGNKESRLGAVFKVSDQKHAKSIIHKTYEAPSYLLWIGMVLAVLLAVGLFLFFWKRRIRRQEAKALPAHAYLEDHPATERTASRRRFFQAPDHPVRKDLFQLQKWAGKHKLGRAFNETLSGWLSSKKLSDSRIRTIQEGYEKVRYGGQELSSSEASRYHQAVSEVKKELKQQIKDEKAAKKNRS